MFPSLVVFSILSAPGAIIQAWTPVEDVAARAFFSQATAAVPRPVRTPARIWPQIVPLLAPSGILHGIDVIGLEDHSPHQLSQGWVAARSAEALMAPLSHVFMLAGDAHCAQSECTFEASHFETRVALRRAPEGEIRVVGVFETNGMVNDDRAEAIAEAHGAWVQEVATRYGGAAANIQTSPEALASSAVADAALPAVAGAPSSPAAEDAARTHNRAGLEHLKARRYDAAIGAFEQSVRADPSYLLSRYNLACALSLSGRFVQSRRVLEQFQVAKDCVGCQVRLFRARSDADFKAQRDDPDFRARVADARLPVVTARAAAQAVEAHFSGGAKGISGFVNPHGTITVQVAAAGGGGVEKRAVRGHALAATISELLGTTETPVAFGTMFKMVCEGACCADTDQMVGPRAVFLDKVCVKTDAAGWTTIDRIELTRGE